MPTEQAAQARVLPASSVATMATVTSNVGLVRAPRLAMGKASRAKGEMMPSVVSPMRLNEEFGIKLHHLCVCRFEINYLLEGVYATCEVFQPSFNFFGLPQPHSEFQHCIAGRQSDLLIRHIRQPY